MLGCWSMFNILTNFTLHNQQLIETVALVEDIVVEDLPKLNRCTELMSMQEELNTSKEGF